MGSLGVLLLASISPLSVAGIAGARAVAAASAPRVAVRAAALAPGTLREGILGPSTEVSLFGITSGPDGNLWFTDLGCIGLGRCSIGRIAAGGSVTLLRRGLNAHSVPYTIAAAAGGDLWFTDEGAPPAIGRITPGGRIREFSRGLSRGSEPFGITPGRGGDLWFTDQGTRPAIGRITPSGAITEFRAGLARGSVPFGIATGRDGRVWFTDRGCAGTGRCAIGSVTPDGRISERGRLSRASRPLGIAAGPGGDMWFADAAGAIGRVTPAGRVRERSRGLARGSSPTAVATGPDGALWFSDEGAQPAIGRLTPTGALREYSRGLFSGSQPAQLTAAPDGRVWFTDEGSTAAIGAAWTGVKPALVSPPVVSGAPAPGASLSCRAARWSSWAGLVPSLGAATFDGFGWLRDGVTVADARSDSFTPSAVARGQRFACRETVTYPWPLSMTAAATSATVTGS
ncbi:MAG: hypothetical protein WBQ18_02390 [Solirubrobacteraceae bacterium]